MTFDEIPKGQVFEWVGLSGNHLSWFYWKHDDEFFIGLEEGYENVNYPARIGPKKNDEIILHGLACEEIRARIRLPG